MKFTDGLRVGGSGVCKLSMGAICNDVLNRTTEDMPCGLQMTNAKPDSSGPYTDHISAVCTSETFSLDLRRRSAGTALDLSYIRPQVFLRFCKTPLASRRIHTCDKQHSRRTDIFVTCYIRFCTFRCTKLDSKNKKLPLVYCAVHNPALTSSFFDAMRQW